MSYTDKQITCHDCGTVFTFSVKEQEQFASIGRFNAPKRCVDCRAKRKPANQKVKVLFLNHAWKYKLWICPPENVCCKMFHLRKRHSSSL